MVVGHAPTGKAASSSDDDASTCADAARGNGHAASTAADASICADAARGNGHAASASVGHVSARGNARSAEAPDAAALASVDQAIQARV
jgi:hypothetical protein